MAHLFLARTPTKALILRFFAFFAFWSLCFLIVIGAFVRISGAGLGCPDWPKCWGKFIPPMQIEQVDFSSLDLEKFQRVAKKYGYQEEITIDFLKEKFSAKNAWIEYINRLSTLPLSLSLLCFSLSSLFFKEWKYALLSFLSLFLVGLNAWFGAKVVLSQLYPGLITLHMLFAVLLFLLLLFQAFTFSHHRQIFLKTQKKEVFWLKCFLFALFFITLIIFLLGTGVREITDSLAHSSEISRWRWSQELKKHWAYFIHRSFSWVIISLFFPFLFFLRKFDLLSKMRLKDIPLEKVLLIILVSQFLLGFIFSHYFIPSILQFAHLILSFSFLGIIFFLLLSVSFSEKVEEGS